MNLGGGVNSEGGDLSKPGKQSSRRMNKDQEDNQKRTPDGIKRADTTTALTSKDLGAHLKWDMAPGHCQRISQMEKLVARSWKAQKRGSAKADAAQNKDGQLPRVERRKRKPEWKKRKKSSGRWTWKNMRTFMLKQ